MKLTIESTEKFVTVEGVRCRAWKGLTEDGTPCTVLTHRLVFLPDADMPKDIYPVMPPPPSPNDFMDGLLDEWRGLLAKSLGNPGLLVAVSAHPETRGQFILLTCPALSEPKKAAEVVRALLHHLDTNHLEIMEPEQFTPSPGQGDSQHGQGKAGLPGRPGAPEDRGD